MESFKQVRILSCVFAVWHARWHTSLIKVFVIHTFLLKRNKYPKQLVVGITR
nr:MAG TPA: hypothetical protein [Caudoviricetes sp.]DAZ54017.1 MAG TPA: hypothetical protein [Caudoviricetes sp.]